MSDIILIMVLLFTHSLAVFISSIIHSYEPRLGTFQLVIEDNPND